MKITQMPLDRTAKGRPGKKNRPKGLVIHWTANTGNGSDADNNRNYFNHTDRFASAHYIVDDHQIVQCLPEDEMAYHVGAVQYKKAAREKLSRYPNDCTIGIEICVNKDGDFQRTLENTVALAADICHRRGWSSAHIWRHYDITGKDCPRFFVSDAGAKAYGFTSAATAWADFKARVMAAIKEGGPKVKEIPAVFEGKAAGSKGGINDAGRACVPIVELIETFNLPLVANYKGGKVYVRQKKEGE